MTSSMNSDLLQEMASSDQSGYNPRSQLSTIKLSDDHAGNASWLRVTIRKTGRALDVILNPNTYSYSNWNKLKDETKANRKYLTIILATLSIPLIFYLPGSITRAKAARNRYLLHVLNKKRFLQSTLQIQGKRMTLKEIKKMCQNDSLNN